MSPLSKALLISFLLVLLNSQTQQTKDSLYDLNGQTFSYIYGSGDSAGSSSARNTSSNANAYTPDSSYTPPVQGPAPATINCPVNQVYDNVLCQCVCVKGYYFANSTCVVYTNIVPTCGRNQVYQNNRCVCAPGFFLIGSVCDSCPPYSTYNLNTTSCVCAEGYVYVAGDCRLVNVVVPVPVPQPITCSINQQLVNGTCVCLKDFYVVKGVCTYCVAPNYYDTQNAICRPTCAINQVLDLGTNTCICNSGFVNIQGQCGQCPAYSVYNKLAAQCACINGYTFNSGACIPSTTPPTIPQTSKQPSDCSDPNAFYIAAVGCVCSTNYHLIGGFCQQCPTNTFYDPDLGICRIACQANEAFNIITGNCDCANTYFRINGTCSQCLGNTTYNPQTVSCSCPAGYRQTSGGLCVVGCGVN